MDSRMQRVKSLPGGAGMVGRTLLVPTAMLAFVGFDAHADEAPVPVVAAALSADQGADQAASGTAAQTSASGSGITDIVVTASRREQKLQDVGISITALGSEALRSFGVRQTTDIVAQVPSLKYNAYSPSITVFNIRGVSQNSFDDHIEPPNAFYIDDAYVAVSGAQGVPTFDIQRVEVLRGPQGTLFGRNATGGLIHFISTRPTKELDGYMDFTGGTNGHASGEAAIGGPLADWVQARVSGVYNYRDPYIHNNIGPGTGGENNYGIRAELAMQPSSDIDVLVIARYARNDHEKQGSTSMQAGYYNSDGLGYAIGPNDNPWHTCPGCDGLGYRPSSNPYQISSDDQGTFFDRKIYGLQGRFEWNLGFAKLTSITDYQQFSKYKHSDDDGTPNPIFDDTYWANYHQISEELRIAQEHGRFRWTTGLYYFHSKSTEGVNVTSEALFGTPTDPYITQYNAIMPAATVSVFGQAEYDILPNLTFIGGLRYVIDTRTADIHLFDTFGTDFYFNPRQDPNARERYKDYAARAQLDYKITHDIMAYASFNRGIKGGSFIAPLFAPANPNVTLPPNIPYKGETLLAYEVGLKSSFLNNRVRFNIDGFDYDYQNYQAYFYLNLASAIRNRPAINKGIEAELTVAPVTGLTLSTGVSALDTKVRDISLPFGRVVDTQMPQAPGFSGNFVGRYETPVSDNLKMAVQYDMTFTDHFYFSLYQAPINREPAYAVANGRITVSDREDRWSASLFVRNMFNKVYRLYTLDDTQFGGEIANIWSEPRYFGLELRYRIGNK
jgi:iron complex outermembrane recepter protein